MRAEIISVGTEIVLGSLVDTNAAFVAEKMASLGMGVSRISAVGDSREDLYQTLEETLRRADLILITGGLGPTEDDITKEVLSKLVGERLVLDEGILAGIRRRFRGQRIPEKAIRKQAMIPASAKRIPNPVGTAPGIILEKGDKTIILLPGVPREMKSMMEDGVYPYLFSRLKAGECIRSRTLKVWGMGESQVNEKIGDIMLQQSNPRVGLLAKRGEVHISITGQFAPEVVDEKIKAVEEEIRERLGSSIWGADEETLEGIVARLLKKRGLRIAVAESCTGGLVSHRLTNIPGSSDYFTYGIIGYTSRAKSIFLGVPASLIKKRGAVSPEVAKKMAQGVRKAGEAHLGLGITGIAGPSGGSPSKPVGLVYIGISSSEGEICERFIFPGDREDIKWKASQGALDMLRRYLSAPYPAGRRNYFRKESYVKSIKAKEGEIFDIELEEDLIKRNEELARKNRDLLDKNKITAIDVMGSVGSGKTSLIKNMVSRLKGKYRLGVVAGDLTTTLDAQRIKEEGVEVIQVNTGKECHLDANLIRRALKEFDLGRMDFLFIENVGNLICPAEFPLGSHKRAVVVSVTEGPWMVTKHPYIFSEADLVVINKIDLARAMGVSVESIGEDVHRIKPGLKTIPTNCLTGEGIEEIIKVLFL